MALQAWAEVPGLYTPPLLGTGSGGARKAMPLGDEATLEGPVGAGNVPSSPALECDRDVGA